MCNVLQCDQCVAVCIASEGMVYSKCAVCCSVISVLQCVSPLKAWYIVNVQCVAV